MKWLKQRDKVDLAGGSLIMLTGFGAILEGASYQVGSLAQMGPGFFPVAIGAILILLGALIALTASPAPQDDSEPDLSKEAPEWRGWACIILGVVAFIVLGKWGGLVPATFALVLISALGDREQTLKHALVLATGVTIAGVIIFSYLLELQFPLFNWG